MLATDTKGIPIQVFAPNKFDEISLVAGVPYEFTVSQNNSLKADMIEYECEENIQITINTDAYGLPKKTHLFGINKGVETIKFTSTANTTLFLAWMV